MSSMFGAGRKLALAWSIGVGALALSAVACSEGSESNAGTGGASDGGTTGTGGASATGGASGETGGAATTGGTTATAGQGGAAETAEKVLFAFDSDREQWVLNNWVEDCVPADAAAGGGTGAAGAAGAAGTATAAAGAPGKPCTGPANLFATTTLAWTEEPNKPNPGALKVTIPFTDFKQQATIEYNFETPQDFSGKMLTVQVQHSSGFNTDPSFPGGFQFFVKTGDDWVYGQAPWVNIEDNDTGTWVEFQFVLDDAETFDTDNPEDTAYDPAFVRSVGVSFNTGDGAKPDAATQPASKPIEAVFYVDSLQLEPVE